MANAPDGLEAIFERGQTEASGQVRDPGPARRAFLSASTNIDTAPLKDTLRSRGFAPFELDEVAAEGRTIPELLEDCVKGADLMVAVVGGGSRENVLFELGYASALKTPILALVPPGEAMPISLASIPYLRTGPNNREAIEFGLDTLLAVPPSSRPSRESLPRRPAPSVLWPMNCSGGFAPPAIRIRMT